MQNSLSMLMAAAVLAMAGVVPALATEPAASRASDRPAQALADIARTPAPDGAQSAAFIGRESDGAPFIGRTAGDPADHSLSSMALAHVALAKGAAANTVASGS